MTTHLFRVTFHRDDREDAIDCGTAQFTRKDYDAFDGPQARAALIADGRLKLGPAFAEYGDVLVPIEKIDRVTVSLVTKGR